VHARDEAAAARAIASVQGAVSIGDEPAHARAPVLARILAG
jgi:hypothetical protein